ncbi:MAG: hypothetical protein JO287_23190 [Pseudonocardiales bacterium]|nr:hypothetical protein [Pseudonocardiales bacterium]
MFDALSYTEIDGQHAELLPTRTLMSLFGTHGGKGGNCNSSNGNVETGGLLGVGLLQNVNALNNVDVVGNGLIPIDVLGHQGMCVS